MKETEPGKGVEAPKCETQKRQGHGRYLGITSGYQAVRRLST